MGQSTTVIPTGGGGAKVQDSIPTNPQKGDLWVDTSETPPVTKWYDGSSFSSVIQIVGGTRHRSIGTQSISETETFFSGGTRTLVADVTYSTDKDNIETISAFFDFSNTGGAVWEYADDPRIFYADGTTDTITGYAGTRIADYDSYPIELPLLENKKLDNVQFNIFNNGSSTLDQTVYLDIESSFSAVDSSPHTHEIP